MAWLKSLRVTCPVCKAQPHKPCKNVITQKPYSITMPHQTRIETAQRKVA